MVKQQAPANPPVSPAVERIPRVSIGLPVYNGAKYLAASLDSLLAQTFSDFELVISDNGSTDDTQRICQAYAARDPRIRYFRSDENHGAAWNFSRVFELSRGEFFKWATHDDLHAFDFLAHAVRKLDRNPDSVWCHSRRAEVDGDGQRISAADSVHAEVSWPPVYAATNPVERFRAVLHAPGARLDIYGLGRREAFGRTGLHRAYFGADKVFLAELALLGRWVEIPEVLFFMRWHAGQSSWIPSQHGQEQWVAGSGVSRLRPPRQLRCLIGYLLLALNAPLGIVDRCRCLVTVAGFAMQARKWKRLGVDVLRKLGLRVRVPEDALRPGQQVPAGK